MQLSDLAWMLADSITGYLTDHQRFGVYVALGAGDYQTVIRDLARTAAEIPLALPASAAGALNAWNRLYGDGPAGAVKSVPPGPVSGGAATVLNVAEMYCRRA